MPELPEVETIRRQLQTRLVHQMIKTVEVRYPKVVHGLSVPGFIRALKGKTIQSVGRQGKLLLLRLTGQQTLVVHLKMTGRLLWAGTPSKFTEIILTFKNGQGLLYDDLRRFGYWKLLPTSAEARLVQKSKLGRDFFDRVLTLKKFKTLLRSRGNSQIKPLLMDQSLLAGLGNIYAQEGCFLAKIYPTRKVRDLTDQELTTLYQTLHSILRKAIQYGGTSVDDYRDALGKKGQFASYLKVYGRAGQSCRRCKNKLVKKNIGGRGTVFCPRCQG